MPSKAFAGVCALLLALLLGPFVGGQPKDTLPASLSDRDFWALTSQLSEPNGYFVSQSGSPDNLLSNENTVSTVAAALADRVKPGGVYLGVGPEQNFSYIVAIKPRMAFITDIRRGNLQLHLLYKAAFDMSATRAEFIGRLFGRKTPAGLTTKSTAAEILGAYLRAEPTSDAVFKADLKSIDDHLMKTRNLPLDADDLAGIEYIYQNFHRFGLAINYTSSINGRSGSNGSYAAILSSTDAATGAERTYLASEETFALIKAMEARNLIVPIVGDFAGPRALRAVGTYLKNRGSTVSAFYVSNVEMYLQRNGVWPAFCANVATLPLDAGSIFIRPGGSRGAWFSAMTTETAGCVGK